MRIKLPETDLKSVQSLVALSSNTKAVDTSANTFSERVTAGPSSYSGSTRALSRPTLSVKPFIDGVTAVIDDNRSSRSKQTEA